LIVCEAEPGITASAMLFTNASLTFITSDAPLFGTLPSHQGPVDIVIAYRAVTFEGSEHLSSSEGPYLHVGHLSIPESANSSSFHFCVRKEFCSEEKSEERCFDDTEGRIVRVIARSAREGRYSFSARIDGHIWTFMT
jgi:hypothetical protein